VLFTNFPYEEPPEIAHGGVIGSSFAL